MPKEKLSIIKIGGNIIEDESSLDAFLKLFTNLEGNKIVLHQPRKIQTLICLKAWI